MNLFGIGTGELLIILLIALLVLGPERLPEIARLWARFSRTVGQFTRAWQHFNAQLNAELNRELNVDTKRPAAPSPATNPSAVETASRTIAPPPLPATTSDHDGPAELADSPDLPSQPAAADLKPTETSRHESE